MYNKGLHVIHIHYILECLNYVHCTNSITRMNKLNTVVLEEFKHIQPDYHHRINGSTN